MRLIVKYFFLADILFWRVRLRFGKKHFPLTRCFIWGSHLRFSHLEFGKIWWLLSVKLHWWPIVLSKIIT